MDLNNIVNGASIRPDKINKNNTKGNHKKYPNHKKNGFNYLERMISDHINGPYFTLDDYHKRYDILLETSDLYKKFYDSLDVSKYSLADVVHFANEQTNKYTGLLISAAMNKIIKDGEEVYLQTKVPLDHLFYKFKRGYGKVTEAGNNFGMMMKGGRVKARKVGDNAFSGMRGGYGEADEAGSWFGKSMKNGSVKADSVKDYAFYRMEGGLGEVKKAGHYFGESMKNGSLKADEVIDYAFSGMEGGLGEVKKAGSWFGESMKDGSVKAGEVIDYAFSEMEGGYGEVDKAGDYFGESMKDGSVKAKVVGVHAFYGMEGGYGEVDQPGHSFHRYLLGGIVKVNISLWSRLLNHLKNIRKENTKETDDS